MSRVYWDSMMFIYLQEGNPKYAPLVRRAYDAMVERNDTLCTSVFTVGELLTLPKARNNHALIESTRNFMVKGDVELLPFTLATAEKYSEVRATTGLKAGDAIHLATALEEKVRLFVTNDHQIQRLRMPGLPLMVGLDGKIF